MRFKYLPLSQNAQDTDSHLPGKGGDRSLTRLFRWNFLVPPLLAVLLVVCLLVGLGAVERQKSPTDYGESSLASSHPEARLPSSTAIIDPPSTTWNRFWWNTIYSPKNHSESDELWEAILPSYGFVAMDRKWAKRR